jgi:hypothetical protein
MSQHLALPRFARRTLPSSYVCLDDDASVGKEVFERCAARRSTLTTTTSPGSHEAMLSQPGPLTAAIIEVSH